jgi:acetyl-CoA carboxylase biotin carboxyl carrier protein
MDFKQIQELVRLVNKSHISELSIEEDKFKISIKRESRLSDGGSGDGGYVSGAPVIQQMVPVVPAAQPAARQPAESAPVAEKPAAEGPKENQVVIKSPMIGTFYRSPGPDKAAFVNIGDEISPGKVVCMIEAMKLFNEIESEISGKIVKVLVEDASPVEYDQPLFLIES